MLFTITSIQGISVIQKDNTSKCKFHKQLHVKNKVRAMYVALTGNGLLFKHSIIVHMTFTFISLFMLHVLADPLFVLTQIY